MHVAAALGPDGALYAAALSASAVADEEHETEGPTPAKSAVAGGRSTVYRLVPDSSAISWWTSPQPFVYALLGGRGGLFAATGNRAGVFRIERPNGATQWLAPPQGQVTALAAGADGAVWAATSNGGTLWRLGPEHAPEGEILSPVLDARRIARFGRVRVRGEEGGARVSISTRSGNTDPPDTTWTGWTGGAAGEEGARVTSPPARYLQWRLELRGGTPQIESVETSWREVNLPPRVEDLVVAPQAQGFQSGEAQPRIEPVTQTLPGGQKVEYSINTPSGAKPLRDLPVFARGLRTITWKATDPNGDALHYRVEVRREGQPAWIKLGDDLDAAAFTWDTNALPDGRYRVRVIATDAPSNPIGEERTDEAVSAPFTVDNTPPVVESLSARPLPRAVEVEGAARDGQSTLSRIEASLDDGDWRPISPDGGFADQPSLAFRGRIADVEPGDHLVAVRAVDAAGNTAVRSVHVTVPRAR